MHWIEKMCVKCARTLTASKHAAYSRLLVRKADKWQVSSSLFLVRSSAYAEAIAHTMEVYNFVTQVHDCVAEN